MSYNESGEAATEAFAFWRTALRGSPLKRLRPVTIGFLTAFRLPANVAAAAPIHTTRP